MQAISTQQLRSLRTDAEGLLVINTLDPEHFAGTHIPAAINIPQSQDNFASKVAATAITKDRPIVVYCASEDCPSSTEAAKKLDAAGFSQIYDYEGGAKAWEDAGESLVAS